jgi:hypothetical protein
MKLGCAKVTCGGLDVDLEGTSAVCDDERKETCWAHGVEAALIDCLDRPRGGRKEGRTKSSTKKDGFLLHLAPKIEL